MVLPLVRAKSQYFSRCLPGLWNFYNISVCFTRRLNAYYLLISIEITKILWIVYTDISVMRLYKDNKDNEEKLILF